MDAARSVVKMALAAALGLLATGCGVRFPVKRWPVVSESRQGDILLAERVARRIQGNAVRRPDDLELAWARDNIAAWSQGRAGALPAPTKDRGVLVAHWRRGEHPRQPDLMAFLGDVLEVISDPDQPLLERALAVPALPIAILMLAASQGGCP